MKKKLISLDADGTLWYPKSTKRTKAPHWVYADVVKSEDYLKELVLIPTTLETLKTLQSAGFKLIVLSTNPFPPPVAVLHMKEKIDYFGLDSYFEDVLTSPDCTEGKGEVLSSYLAKNGYTKDEVVHIGDSYRYDYASMMDVYIDVVLIKTAYSQLPKEQSSPLNTVNDLSEIIPLLKLSSKAHGSNVHHELLS